MATWEIWSPKEGSRSTQTLKLRILLLCGFKLICKKKEDFSSKQAKKTWIMSRNDEDMLKEGAREKVKHFF